MFESSRQSVDGEDAGKRIFAHLFEEDIKKQAIVKRDVEKVTVVLGFSPHVFETALANNWWRSNHFSGEIEEQQISAKWAYYSDRGWTIPSTIGFFTREGLIIFDNYIIITLIIVDVSFLV